MRRQDSNPAKPNLNKQMLDKWTELWTGHRNPTVGVSMRDWDDTVGPIYEQWRLNELNTAKAKGIVPPPLFSVTFVMAKEWANEMKEQSSSPLRLRSGAFNEASQTMSNKLNAYINSNDRPENVTLFQNNNIGNNYVILNYTKLSRYSRKDLLYCPCSHTARSLGATASYSLAQKGPICD
jgi:hypothetical protein